MFVSPDMLCLITFDVFIKKKFIKVMKKEREKEGKKKRERL
jgi:hypothetical protein